MPNDQTSDFVLNRRWNAASGAVHLIGNLVSAIININSESVIDAFEYIQDRLSNCCILTSTTRQQFEFEGHVTFHQTGRPNIFYIELRMPH